MDAQIIFMDEIEKIAAGIGRLGLLHPEQRSSMADVLRGLRSKSVAYSSAQGKPAPGKDVAVEHLNRMKGVFERIPALINRSVKLKKNVYRTPYGEESYPTKPNA